jgi:DNA-binding Lrp family transcriptional regulator
MVTAFVLISVEDKKLQGIGDALLELPGVKEVHVVAGEYDMVAVLRVGNNAELSKLLTEKLIHIAGVHRTKTLISLESFSEIDLARTFGVD